MTAPPSTLNVRSARMDDSGHRRAAKVKWVNTGQGLGQCLTSAFSEQRQNEVRLGAEMRRVTARTRAQEGLQPASLGQTTTHAWTLPSEAYLKSVCREEKSTICCALDSKDPQDSPSLHLGPAAQQEREDTCHTEPTLPSSCIDTSPIIAMF